MAEAIRMKSRGSQLQQKNATASVDYNINHEEFGWNQGTWEKRLDNKFSQMRKEVGRVIQEEMQEFFMMLYKECQLSISARFFCKSGGEVLDKYDCNKGFWEDVESESQIYVGKQKEKGADGIALDQANLTEGPAICADIGAGVLPQILDLPKTEEQSDLDQNIDPFDKLMLTQSGAKSGNARNIHPRPGQGCDGPHADEEGLIEQPGLEQSYIGSTETDPKDNELGQAFNKDLDQRKKLEVEKRHSFVGTSVGRYGFGEEGPKDIVPLPLVPKQAELSLAWVKIGVNQSPVLVLAEEQLKQIEQKDCNKAWKRVEDKFWVYDGGQETAWVVLTPSNKSEFLSTVLKDRPMAAIGVATTPSSGAHRQPFSECPQRVNNSPLLHFQDVVADIFAIELGSGLNGETITAATDVGLPSSSRLQISVVLFDQWRVIDFGCVLVDMDMRTTAVTIIFVSSEEYPSTKKKKHRRRKREKEIKPIMKVGVG